MYAIRSYYEVGREAADPRREALRLALLQANSEILRVGIERPECLGMGATVVAVSFSSRAFTAIHLGDSRLYRLREGVLAQLTEDHSVVQEFIRQGVLTPRITSYNVCYTKLLRRSIRPAIRWSTLRRHKVGQPEAE